MTFAEKIAQLKYDSPAIERLGVPAYMSFLLRTKSGGQDILDAYSCDELQKLTDHNDFTFIKSPESVLFY